MSGVDYQRAVKSSVGALGHLSGMVLGDLDEQVGGVGWWDGQIDFRRRVVLSEYLLDSLNGAAEALLDAALAAQEHREGCYADDVWLVGVWREVAKDPRATNEDYLRAMQRDPAQLRRERRIDASATHALGHAMHTLDCLAAAVLIVAAVPDGVRRSDWKSFEDLAKKAAAGSSTSKLEPLDQPGRHLQDALLAATTTWQDHGPQDWLPWLRASRNARTHRATRVQWGLLHGTARRPEGLVRPFPPQPDLTDVEVMARSGGAASGDLSPLRILRRSPDVVDALIGSMDGFTTSLAEALTDCWTARRAAPALLCQRGAQWQDLERVADLSFPGYGKPTTVIGDTVHVGDDLARRLRAAHVMDDSRWRWDAQ